MPAGLGNPVTLIIVAATVLGLLLRLYQLSRPGFLLSVNEYDDGPYFGSAVRLVHGAVPYRDFLIVQPPGITLLMIPVALLSKVTGTAWGMATARILTSLIGAVAVALAGLLVRHRGVLATVIVCGIMAVYPDAIQATKTLLVEPWLVLFCLIGALAVFDGDHFTTRTRRLVWGGVAFGFGGAVEPWAIFPVIIITVLALRWPRRAAAYVGGVAAGFLVPVLPFAALAPKKFYQATIIAQIGPRAGATRTSTWERIQDLTGLADLHKPTHLVILGAAVLIAAVVAGSLGLAFLLTSRLPPMLDLFAVGTAGFVLIGFIWPNQFHYHFAAFFAPWLALAIGLPLAALVRDLRLISGGDAGAATPPALQWGAACVAGLVILVMAVVQFNWESYNTPHLPLSVVQSRGAPDPAGVVPACRRGVVRRHDQPAGLGRAGLLAAARRHRHQLRALARARPGDRRREVQGGRRGVDLRLRSRAVRVAVRAEPPPGGLDAGARALFQRPLHPDPECRQRGCAVPAYRPETGKLTTGGRDKCRTRSQR